MINSPSDLMMFEVQDDHHQTPVRSVEYGRYPRPAIIIGLIIAYCALHFMIRLCTSPVFALDEAPQMLLSQSLALGYQFENPPLMTWIYALADMTVGLSRPVFFGLKYVIMCIGLIAFYRAAVIIFQWRDPKGDAHQRHDLSAASVAAWSLVYFPAWGHHEDLMQSALLFTLLALTLHAFMAALVSGKWLNWAYFGVTIGAGFLSRYEHAMFPAALIIAACSLPVLSRTLRNELGDTLSPARITPLRILFSVSIGLAIIAPYAWWVWTNHYSFIDLISSATDLQTVSSDSPEHLAAALFESRRNGLLSLVQAMVQFTLPFSVFFIMLFWPMWFPFIYPFFPRRDVSEVTYDKAWRQLLFRTMLIGSAFFFFAVLAGSQSFQARWMHQVLIPLPIWLFLHVQRSGPYFISMRAFAALVGVFISLAAFGRIVEWREDIKNCDVAQCRAYLPVKDWTEALHMEGFSSGTIVGAEYQLSGNLRYMLPGARVLDAEFAPSAFPPPTGRGACLAVWRDAAAMPPRLVSYLRDDLNVKVSKDDTSPEGAIRRYLLKSDDKASVLYYRYLKPTRTCR